MNTLKSLLTIIFILKFNLIAQDYERIIHFERNDYLSPNIQTGAPVNGIQGITAGSEYLVIWNMNEFYIFDIKNYQKLKTIPTETSIKQIAIINNQFYVLAQLNYIYVFNLQGEIKRYNFYSYINNYDDMRKIIKRKEDRTKDFHTKSYKRKRKTEKWISGTRRDIRGIYNIGNQIYLNVDFSLLNLNDDFSKETRKMESIHPYGGNTDIDFIFPKEEIKKKGHFHYTNYFWKTHILNWEERNHFELDILNINREKTETIEVHFEDNDENLLQNCNPHFLINNKLIIIGKWISENQSPKVLTHKMIIYNTLNKTYSTIVLGNENITEGLLKNSYHYQAFFNGNVYYILYSGDGNFDVLKIKIET